ncbi:FG-GAP repeat domain-containing protein, partial [Phyllobacterium leguminum]|uniref:FG-GAP repeat domain-containing protein n=1 Tax=Phyllobacterium leguminum TaxID=314237 RepID=UPI0011B37509
TSDTQPLTVTGQYPTTTTLGNPDGNTPPYNLPVTVTGIAPSPLAPTGTVEIIDHTSGVTLGSVNPGNPTYGVNATYLPGALTAGIAPWSVADGDFNADGIKDIAAANHDAKTIGVYLGTSDGKFKPPVTFGTEGNPYPIVAGDFDNNGTLDVAFGNGSNLTVFKNPGAGNFNGHVDTPASDFQDLVAGDFDNDGNLDVAVVHASSNTTQVYLGNGQNAFPTTGTALKPGQAGGSAANGAAAGDFNKDGKLDLLVPDSQWNGQAWVLIGDGQGNFAPGVGYGGQSSGRVYTQTVAVADFDADGNLDFAIGLRDNDTGSSIQLFQGQDGNGTTFKAKTPVPLTQWDNNGKGVDVSVVAADFNADGIADLASVGNGKFDIWTGDGNWKFTSVAFGPAGYSPRSPVTGDFDGDGFMDIAAGDGSAVVSVTFSEPTATVTGTAQNVPAPVGTGTHDVWADYDGDSEGNFAPSASGTVPLAAKKLDTTLALKADPQSPVVAWQKVTLSATLGTGNQDLQGQAPSGDVTFSIQNGK